MSAGYLKTIRERAPQSQVVFDRFHVQRLASDAVDGVRREQIRELDDPAERRFQADLLATSTGLYCGTAIIPLFTILSLGAIPTIFTDRDCEGVSFRAGGSGSGGSSNSVEVRYQEEGRVIYGLARDPHCRAGDHLGQVDDAIAGERSSRDCG